MSPQGGKPDMQKIFSIYKLRPGVYRFEVYAIEGTNEGEITFIILRGL